MIRKIIVKYSNLRIQIKIIRLFTVGIKYFTLKENAEISKNEENLWFNISVPETKIKYNALEKVNALHIINTVCKCISFSYLENVLMYISPKAR